MQFRREVDQTIARDALVVERRRLGRKRLRGGVPFSRHISLRNGAFFHWPDRLAVFAIENVKECLFGWLRYGFHRLAVNGDVGENRSARDVHIPYAVMNELIVPLPLARF